MLCLRTGYSRDVDGTRGLPDGTGSERAPAGHAVHEHLRVPGQVQRDDQRRTLAGARCYVQRYIIVTPFSSTYVLIFTWR